MARRACHRVHRRRDQGMFSSISRVSLVDRVTSLGMTRIAPAPAARRRKSGFGLGKAHGHFRLGIEIGDITGFDETR